MSVFKYKCCARVFSSYYVCTQCSQIIHRGCVANGRFKGNLQVIEGHKVNCCKPDIVDIEKSITIMEEKNALLEETLGELTTDSQLKYQQLEKVKKDYEFFINEASIREDELNKIIVKNEETIKSLSENLTALRNQLEVYTTKLQKTCSTQTEIRARFNDCSSQTECQQVVNAALTANSTEASLPSPTPVLTQRKEPQQNPQIPPKITDSVYSPSPSVEKLTSNFLKQRRILLLADDFGRDIGKPLKSLLDASNYNIQTLYKPGAKFLNVIEDVKNLTKDFTLRDHVVIAAGTNNFVGRGEHPLFRHIWSQIKLCPDTNFTFVGVPYANNYYANELIHKFNNKLLHFCNKLHSCLQGYFSFIDVNQESNIMRKGKLCKLIYRDIVLAENSCQKNLIFVRTCDAVVHCKNVSSRTGGSPNKGAESTVSFPPSLGVHGIDVSTDSTDFLGPHLPETLPQPVNTNSTSNIDSGNFLYPRLSQVSLDEN